MCTKIVINKLYLGNRELGYELFSDGEIIEMTEKQIISEIKSGKDIRGLVIGNDNKLELDTEGFGMRNLMEKRHIGNYKPMIEDGCMVNMVNMFVTVIGCRETENGLVYEGITNRFKRVDLDEALLVTYYNMGIINGGVVLNDDGTLKMPIDMSNKAVDIVVEKPAEQEVETIKVEAPVEDEATSETEQETGLEESKEVPEIEQVTEEEKPKKKNLSKNRKK